MLRLVRGPAAWAVGLGLLAASCTPNGDPTPDPGAEDGPDPLQLSEGFELPEATWVPEASGLELVLGFDLDAPPMDLAWSNDATAYLGLGSGEILKLEVGDEGVVAALAARGEGQLRSVEVVDDTLYVAEADFPCTEVVPGFDLVRCKGGEFPDLSREETKEKIALESTGRVVAYEIGDGGALGDRRVVLDDLPIGDSDHALNGMVAGPDGFIYISLGDIDGRYQFEDVADMLPAEQRELLGTVSRFRPDGGELEVYARGLRNVYHLTFDDEGHLYGVDNDGPAANSYRFEEVIRFKQGAHYGYPTDGSLAVRTIRTGEALWFLSVHGAAGIEWGPRVGLDGGLVVGACLGVQLVGFEGAYPMRGSETTLLDLGDTNTCAPLTKATPDGRLVVGTLNPHRLLIYSAAG